MCSLLIRHSLKVILGQSCHIKSDDICWDIPPIVICCGICCCSKWWHFMRHSYKSDFGGWNVYQFWLETLSLPAGQCKIGCLLLLHLLLTTGKASFLSLWDLIFNFKLFFVAAEITFDECLSKSDLLLARWPVEESSLFLGESFKIIKMIKLPRREPLPPVASANNNIIYRL